MQPSQIFEMYALHLGCSCTQPFYNTITSLEPTLGAIRLEGKKHEGGQSSLLSLRQRDRYRKVTTYYSLLIFHYKWNLGTFPFRGLESSQVRAQSWAEYQQIGRLDRAWSIVCVGEGNVLQRVHCNPQFSLSPFVTPCSTPLNIIHQNFFQFNLSSAT